MLNQRAHLSRSEFAAWPLAVSFALLFLTGCASTQPGSDLSTDAHILSVTADSVAHELRQATEQWAGTPYQFGGDDRSGIDCSGFVALLYAEVLNRSVPRTTGRQVRAGRSVSAQALQPGDLVFFWLPPKQRHVGVYLRDNRFAHASVSQGVTISNLEDPYWRHNYWTARRLLSNLPSEQPTPASSQSRRSSSDRSGW